MDYQKTIYVDRFVEKKSKVLKQAWVLVVNKRHFA